MKKLVYCVISCFMLPFCTYGSSNTVKKDGLAPKNNYSFNAHKQIKARYHTKNRLKSLKPKNTVKNPYQRNKSFKV